MYTTGLGEGRVLPPQVAIGAGSLKFFGDAPRIPVSIRWTSGCRRTSIRLSPAKKMVA
jgi:hypothetical protein